MSDTAVSLRRKIASAGDLESVVRTMKAMAASSISQYEQAVRALDDYYRAVELGLAASFRKTSLVGRRDAGAAEGNRNHCRDRFWFGPGAGWAIQ